MLYVRTELATILYTYARAAFPYDIQKFLYISCICPLPDDGPEMDEISLR